MVKKCTSISATGLQKRLHAPSYMQMTEWEFKIQFLKSQQAIRGHICHPTNYTLSFVCISWSISCTVGRCMLGREWPRGWRRCRKPRSRCWCPSPWTPGRPELRGRLALHVSAFSVSASCAFPVPFRAISGIFWTIHSLGTVCVTIYIIHQGFIVNLGHIVRIWFNWWPKKVNLGIALS
jgi:hypothetical protein